MEAQGGLRTEGVLLSGARGVSHHTGSWREAKSTSPSPPLLSPSVPTSPHFLLLPLLHIKKDFMHRIRKPNSTKGHLMKPNGPLLALLAPLQLAHQKGSEAFLWFRLLAIISKSLNEA